MTRRDETRYYESDTPCRKCNGTRRYRNTVHKGQCANCVVDDERDRWARNWVKGVGGRRSPDSE